jgi:hypothetical protein
MARLSLVAEGGGGAADLDRRRWGTTTWARVPTTRRFKHGGGEIGAASGDVGDGRDGVGGRGRNRTVNGLAAAGGEVAVALIA